MSETFKPTAIIRAVIDDETRLAMFENIRAQIDAAARRLGVVEVEVLVGDEPEEGVEFEVVPSMFNLEDIRPSTASKLLTGDWDLRPVGRK